MARKKKTEEHEIGEFSSMTLMIPKKLYDEAMSIALSQGKDLGNLLMVDTLNLLKTFVKENKSVGNKDLEDDGLFQFDIFSNDVTLDSNANILPSSKDVGASRLLVDDDEDQKITMGQFWFAFEKKLSPYMGDKESSLKTKRWMGGLIKKYGSVNAMNALMKLDGLTMMPADPVAWIAKVLSKMSDEDNFKRNHGSKKHGGKGSSSGGMVNI